MKNNGNPCNVTFHTPAEARSKFCCSNRHMCGGDECMAWRWVMEKSGRDDGQLVQGTQGYCGRAHNDYQDQED